MRPARVRAGVFTLAGLSLSACAHVVGEGDAPAAGPLIAVSVLSLLTVGVLGRTRRGPVAASLAMVGLQVGAHLALVTPAGGHQGHHHGAGLDVPPWPMLLAHLLSAVLLASWLTGVDRALGERLLAAVAVPVAPRLEIPRLRVVARATSWRPSPQRVLLPCRGPPGLSVPAP